MRRHLALSLLGVSCVAAFSLSAQPSRHTFTLGEREFLLDGQPFRIISGELHPARIPREYWRHRIRMTKAMGCNTVAAYIFWNYHEESPGLFDFTTGNKDIASFLRIVQEEGMWVLLRPGPYVCAEWDFGGLPPSLLATPDIRVRCMDVRYMERAERYLSALASVVRPFLAGGGGPILMVQIENEYGSYGNDRTYLETVRRIWLNNGVDCPFFTADGPTPSMLEAGSLDGAAIGLDSGSDEKDFLEAERQNGRVPSFSSETYPGWLTHWGEKWARPDTSALLREVRFLLETGKSFNLYVAHGGTNFAFTAGANSGGKGYEPDVTSYDYDAPINEQGRATAKFHALRNLISRYVKDLPEVPPPVPAMSIPPVRMSLHASIWENLPEPLTSAQPRPFEAYGQNHGCILYRTTLIGHKSGTLTVTEPHDYALVFLEGVYLGKLDRREGEKTIVLPKTGAKNPLLEILVEAMGRINYGQSMIDRKGITERVTLNGMTLMNWQVFRLPLDEPAIARLKGSNPDTSRPGCFFRGTFDCAAPADTYIDMGNYEKGVVWVNGHNLGRYWKIGPQQRLYCPAPWLKRGLNEILVFDLHQREPAPVRGWETLE